MDSLALLEEWLKSQETFEEPKNGSDLNIQEVDNSACAFEGLFSGPEPFYDSALDGILNDYLPSNQGLDGDWLLGELDDLKPDGMQEPFGSLPTSLNADVAPNAAQLALGVSPSTNDIERRVDALETELRTLRESFLALRQELDNHNDWSYKLTFIINEIQMRQHGLPPTLRRRGKLLPTPRGCGALGAR